jgi:hypothetical protein
VEVSFLVSNTLAADFLTSSLRFVVFFVDRNMLLRACATGLRFTQRATR